MKKHVIAILLVLLIEVATYLLAKNETGNMQSALELVVAVATLVGLLAVVMLSAEDPFGPVCRLAIGPIVTVVITGLGIVLIAGVNPGALIIAMLCVGVVIVFCLAWIAMDEHIEKRKRLKATDH